jgi:two-component system, OmpR family, response regulator
MRILVVEDEPALRDVVARAFREQGYAVDEAGDGRDALFKATAWQYDAVVLDVMLPGMDGWTILSRLRRNRKTPVLLLTARDAVADRVRGLDTGADDYLVKPFVLAELLARVRALIRRAANQPAPALTIGPVVIDTGAKRVSRSGRPVVLTAREYAIVELLARNRGQVVSRTRIYDHIFDETDDSLSNLVEVHVSNVRKKLGKDFITTRRGLGYVIDG